jgi:pterin-4a-carbinolamine dehydratase
MNEQNTVQELKAERVQEESLALMRKRVTGQGDAVGAAMGVTRNQAEERLKAERVQLRLKRMQGWKMLAEGKAIDRVRQFKDPLVAASYLAFASLLARQAGQPLRISANGGTIIVALTGRSKGPNKGITDEVLDLADQLG